MSMVAERKPTWKETEGSKEIRWGEEKEKDLGGNGAGLIFHVENGPGREKASLLNSQGYLLLKD